MSSQFVGRAAEIAAIAAAVGDGVVTVVGPGGVGKTATATRAIDRYALVELTPLSSEEVAPALDDALATGAPLLLVDNAEHVLDAVAEWLDSHDTPALVTSRMPLGIARERVVELRPLPADDAAALFADRAARAGASAEDDNAIAEVCRSLDNLPLAIELAAARARLLSPRAMLQRLDDRFRVLAEDNRAPQAHHRTLRAAIEWSFDLLDDDERVAMRRLTVFADRFDLDQAAHVGVGIDTLDALVAHSLVMSEPAAGVPYRLLDSVRALARALPGDDPVEGLVAWLAEVTEPLDEPDMVNRDALHARLDTSATDIRRALERADASVALTLFGRLGAWFWDRGRAAEGLRIGQAIADADPGDDTLATARLVNAIANLAVRSGDPASALPLYERALRLRTEAGVHASQLASNQNDLGACLLHLGRLDEAEASLRAARDLYEAVGDRWGVTTATTNLAAVAVTAGRLDGAASAFAEVAREFTALGDDVQAAAALTNQGLVLLQLGEPDASTVLGRAVRTSLRSGMRAVLPAALAGCAATAGATPRAAKLLGAASAAGFVDDGELRTPLEDALGLEDFARFHDEGLHATDDTVLLWVDDREAPPAAPNAWRRTDTGWSVTFDAITIEVPATKGAQYLAQLLGVAGRELHVAELMGVDAAERGTEVADEAALAAYRLRVVELQRRLDDADARADEAAGAAAQAELDALTAELRRATSKGGRVRLVGGDSERARKAVTNRIRDTLRAIAVVHPALGRHLEKAVTTGTFCVYAPEHETVWELT